MTTALARPSQRHAWVRNQPGNHSVVAYHVLSPWRLPDFGTLAVAFRSLLERVRVDRQLRSFRSDLTCVARGRKGKGP